MCSYVRANGQNISAECQELNAKREQTRKPSLISRLRKPAWEFSTFFSFHNRNWPFLLDAIGRQGIHEKQKHEVSTLSGRGSRDSCAFASSPTDRACNLRRSANLGSELEQRAERSISDSSPTRLLGALYQSDLLLLTLRRRASIIIPSLGLSGDDKSCTPQPFCVATLLSLRCIHNDRRKMIKAREGLRLRSFGCSITGLRCSNWCSSASFFFLF